MTHLHFPYDFDLGGGTARTTDRTHAVEMLLQFLLTHPHDRVNRPDFGTPLIRMVHEGNAAGTTDLIQFIVRAGLQRWLGDVIEVMALAVRAEDSTLVVDLTYRVRGDAADQSASYRMPVPVGGAA